MNNEIKNTLFRFVSMRSPELTTDNEEKPGFIFQPEGAVGLFNEAVENLQNGETKLMALQNAAIDFAPNAINLKDLKDLDRDLYEFSVWIAKNKNKANEDDIEAKALTVSESALNLRIIWENLFYQIVTQKDFYIKETLMQLLVAYHVAVVRNGSYKERALAKIVLSNNMFVEEKALLANRNAGSEEYIEVPFANSVFQTLERQIISKENISALQKLKEEVSNAESRYMKDYKKAYDTEYQLHYQEVVKPIIDQHNLDVEGQKSEWCSVKNPSIPYDPTDPCQQPPRVPAPEIPAFEFEFKEELDEVFLKKVLSRESYEVYQILKTPLEEENGESVSRENMYRVNFDSSNGTFNSLNNSISQLIDDENNTVSQNTVDSGYTAVIIGGSTLTVPNTNSPLQPFEYEIKSRSIFFSTVKSLQIMVGIPDDLWKITSVIYKMTRFDDTFVQKNSTTVKHLQGYDVLLNLSMSGINADFKELDVTFQFANGQTANIKITNFILTSIYKGFIRVPISLPDDFDDTGNNTNPGGDSSISPSETFIPSGFGFKQIGIADYNKVEQTIQGYIEGEVAHIENVMAREFKEKSTRRLRRSEITETTSSETEREQLTDTSTVNRFEMQSEVAKLIANSKDFSGGTGMQYKALGGDLILNANASFATHNSKEESARQAVTNSKEITERALDRVVTKVKEERIEKIIEEFEENNTHGFDNRKGDKHVVGVYRWVDKIFKNQIVNYGKRLMFEFAIPEPARLHNLAMQSLIDQNNAKVISMPRDPRTALEYKLENFSQLTDDKLQHWTGIYKVEFKPKPIQQFRTGKALGGLFTNSTSQVESMAFQDEIKIPEGYVAISGTASCTAATDHQSASISALIGSDGFWFLGSYGQLGGSPSTTFGTPYSNVVPISTTFYNEFNGTVNFNILCQLTPEAEKEWKIETFNAIIKAYEEALKNYNETIAVEAENGAGILGTNPGFYREIENVILRKNCISYLISSNPNDKKTFGKDFYTKNNNSPLLSYGNAIINQNRDLEEYASFVKFIEQAFEWDIMSYYFYPHYWGNRDNWVKMYQYDQTNDHIFKAFMQSGMARVIVTVRPGFEEAVRYYMQTGQIWNGGEVPVIGDELYLSIVEEMRKTEGEKVGKAWPTRVPTSLTILQAESIGLKVVKALPYNDDLSDFENEDEVPQSSQISIEPDAQIGGSPSTGTADIIGQIDGSENIESKILLKRIDGSIQDMTYCDSEGRWKLTKLPAGKFELLLDAQNDFPETEFSVVDGSKEQMIILENNVNVEVNLVLNRI